MDTAVRDSFDAWICAKNVKIDGVRAAQIPGKGAGVIADKHIESGQTFIHVPSTALLTVSPNECSTRNVSVHHTLAETLVDHASSFKEWLDVMPTYEDLEGCMPVLWMEELAAKLPEGARNILLKQREKLHHDITHFMNLPAVRNPETQAPRNEETLKAYKRAWLLVNTRSFYWDYPFPSSSSASKGSGKQPPRKRMKKDAKGVKRPLARDDCMALCPFVDFFNHEEAKVGGEVGCEVKCAVSFNHTGFVVTANKHYKPGEEIHVSYGSYSNDFLLVEYGFLYPQNPADSVVIDGCLIPEYINGSKEETLRNLDMLGNYTIYTPCPPAPAAATETTAQPRHPSMSSPTPCHRTQVALRANLDIPNDHLRTFALEGEDHKDADPRLEDRVRDLLRDLLTKTVLADGNKVLSEVDVGKGAAEKLLVERWGEVVSMGERCIGGWCQTGSPREEN